MPRWAADVHSIPTFPSRGEHSCPVYLLLSASSILPSTGYYMSAQTSESFRTEYRRIYEKCFYVCGVTRLSEIPAAFAPITNCQTRGPSLTSDFILSLPVTQGSAIGVVVARLELPLARH